MKWFPLISAISFTTASTCAAQFIVDQQPDRSGGPASDTAFVIFPGHEYAQLVADDFTPSQADSIRAVRWWGYYYLNDTPPPAELMRLRIYSARLADGLPGDVLYEESFTDNARTSTGRTILISGSPREFRYQITLAQPFQLLPGVRYWTELAQLGDPASIFCWENAFPGDGFAAVMVPGGTDWSYLTSPSGSIDQAFQLIAPEPATLVLLALAAALRPRMILTCCRRMLTRDTQAVRH